MQRRQVGIWMGGLVAAAARAAPPAVTLRVARLHAAHGPSPRTPNDDAPDLGLALCSAVTQADPSLRFAPQPMALREPEVVHELAQHRLDLHWDLVSTPRRRERLAFLEGPALWRHRLQLISRAEDTENLHDLAALRQASQRDGLVAATDSVAAEFLSAVPGVRWSPVSGDESPEALLRHRNRWALLPSHAQTRRPRAQPPLPHPAPGPWRWQPWVPQDEPVHGAVSLALPAPIRRRLAHALDRLAQAGVLDALRAQHARA